MKENQIVLLKPMTEPKENLIFPDVLKQLEGLLEKQKLIEYAMENCKTWLIASLKEDEEMGLVPLKGWKLDQIKMVFDKQSLVFKHSLLTYPYIDTQIGLYVDTPENFYWDNLYPMGSYNLITHPGGQVDDDYLIIEERPEDR
jgi:hypothetical protein